MPGSDDFICNYGMLPNEKEIFSECAGALHTRKMAHLPESNKRFI